ncbi:hypothetical protein NP233_g6938 [Leucocoprinus birnbaumii]|uniref:Nephrocystin 3-like N-terminal domain-containing protein n=1 Tax=Leucocoprinus birnbaumii TaxID=56174 RepID=A0AAD5VSI9_9AGAR|nr:hypothetical protein NP233_g6938 [Leucocoprinus birnbaumii]
MGEDLSKESIRPEVPPARDEDQVASTASANLHSIPVGSGSQRAGSGLGPHPPGFFQDAEYLYFYKAQMFSWSQANIDTDDSLRAWLEGRVLQNLTFDAFDPYMPSKCMENTRVSIVKTLVDNLMSRESNFYCLLGPAGIGKTSVMLTVAEIISTHALAATLFFSLRKDSSHLRILPTIALQLSSKDEQYFRYIRRLRDTYPFFYEANLETQFKLLFILPFTKHQMFRDRDKPHVIMLDGLDECTGAVGQYRQDSETIQKTIINLIHGFVLECPGASFVWVVATRPEHYLVVPLQRAQCAIVTLQMDSSDAIEDVQKFVSRSFELVREDYPEQFSYAKAPTATDVNQIASNASGFFQYASAAFGFVKDGSRKTPVANMLRVLEAIRSQLEPTKYLLHPFHLLYSVYAQIMQRIPPEQLEDTKYVLACAMVRSVQYPLNRICTVIQKERYEVYSSLQYLYSVLNVPKEGETNVRYFHRSFREYLLDPDLSCRFCITHDYIKSAIRSYWWGYYRILQQGVESALGRFDPVFMQSDKEANLFDEALEFWITSFTSIKRGKIEGIQLEGVPNFCVHLKVSELLQALRQVYFSCLQMYIPTTPKDLPLKVFHAFSWLYSNFSDDFTCLVDQILLHSLEIEQIDFNAFSCFRYHDTWADTPTHQRHPYWETLQSRKSDPEFGSIIIRTRRDLFPHIPVMIWGDRSSVRCAMFRLDYQAMRGSVDVDVWTARPPSLKELDWEVFLLPYKPVY